jgi:hypothetical protein
MATFECSYAELRKVAAEYIKAIPGANQEELEAGLKCFQLHYLGMQVQHDHEIAGASALFRIVSREYMNAELALALAD